MGYIDAAQLRTLAKPLLKSGYGEYLLRVSSMGFRGRRGKRVPFTFKTLALAGLVLIEPRVFPDDRGYFLESYKESDFAAAGIDLHFVQDNHTGSVRGVLRGLHYQVRPREQGKLVRVIEGAVWDVAVDLRTGSPTLCQWVGVELSAENRRMLYVPAGFAHGFVTLSESAQFLYKCTAEYDPACERGVRWDDPHIGVQWPLAEVLVSDRDRALPFWRQAAVMDEGRLS